MVQIWIVTLAAVTTLPLLAMPLSCAPSGGSIPPGITYEEHLSHHQ